MTDKDLILKEKVEHVGLFDFKGFYAFAHSWFKDEKYGVTEEKYSEKVKGNARDLRIEWKATKTLSDYFKIEQAIVFEIWGMTDVEAEIDGEKKKMNKGTVGAEIKGALVRDHDSKWESSPQWRFLREIYNKYIIPSRVEKMEDKVRGDVQTFKDELKAYLDLLGKR
jgi:hypothetical protein